MTSEDTVRQLRPRGAPGGPPTGVFTPSARELGDRVTELRGWPARTALFLGLDAHPNVVAGLARHGIVALAAATERLDSIASAGPFSFLIIPADTLAADPGVDQVRELHRHSRCARLLLEYSASERRVEVVMRALRAGVDDVFDPEDSRRIDAVVQAGLTYFDHHRERVLAIGAHPDDVELGCAGTMLDHRMRGDQLTILTLSRGEVGGARAARLREATDTAEALGAQLLFGDLPDTRISSGADTVQLMEEVVAVVQPTVVYVHSEHDTHQDHRAASTAAAVATRTVRRVFAYESPSATNDFDPTRFVPIDSVLSRKVEILGLFESQHARSYLDPGAVSAAARYWARHLGAATTYAEPFEVIRTMGDLRSAETTPTFMFEGDDDAVTLVEPRLRADYAAPDAPVRVLRP